MNDWQKCFRFTQATSESFGTVFLLWIYGEENRRNVWEKSHDSKLLENCNTQTAKKRNGEIGA